MILLFRAILIAYLLLWLALLVGCVRKREFCPLLGTSRATRLFWLATFVFFNPVLTILYLLFAARSRQPGRARSRVSRGAHRILRKRSRPDAFVDAAVSGTLT